MHPYKLIFTFLFYFKVCICIDALSVSYVHTCILNIFTSNSLQIPSTHTLNLCSLFFLITH